MRFPASQLIYTAINKTPPVKKFIDVYVTNLNVNDILYARYNRNELQREILPARNELKREILPSRKELKREIFPARKILMRIRPLQTNWKS